MARAECIPRNAYAPRSWLHDVRSLRKTTFAMNKRTFSRAAGVSPPWFSEPHLEVQCAEFRRCELVCGVCSTGGLRQLRLVGNASAARIRRIAAASSTGTSLRPGTRPAHMRIPSADSLRSPRGAYAPRSWLHSAGSPEKTTAAVRSEPRCEKPHSRCTNARLQERRA
jgi:hypothetical protein